MIARLSHSGQLIPVTSRRRARMGCGKPTRRRYTSRYKGVYWDRDKERWRAEITLANRRWRLGRFLSEEDAAVAYDRKAIALFGQFARTNFSWDARAILMSLCDEKTRDFGCLNWNADAGSIVCECIACRCHS